MPARRRQSINNPATAVRSQVPSELVLRGFSPEQSYEDLPEETNAIAWSADGEFISATGIGGAVAIWPLTSGLQRLLRSAELRNVLGLIWHPVDQMAGTGHSDGRVLIWDMQSGRSEELCRIHQEVRGLAWSPDGSALALTDGNGYVGIWDVHTRMLRASVDLGVRTNVPCWSPNGQLLLIPSSDGNVNVQATDDLRLIYRLGHDDMVFYADVSSDGQLAASGSLDGTVRVWDLGIGKEVVALEGHSGGVGCVRFSPRSNFLASQSYEQVRLWRCRDWECVATLPRGDASRIGGLAFHPSAPLLAAKDMQSARVDCFRIDYSLLENVDAEPDSRRYVNAKVMLLGDTGVGKSGLGLVLSGQRYQPTDSTHGRKVWIFDSQEVEVPGAGRQTREVLLWDLAGQPGYRLVHQLHLNEVAVALMVFDSRSEIDPFSGVKHWVRALAQARRLEGTATVPLSSYLVAARADRGGVGVTMERIRALMDDLDLKGFFETSAKEGWQISMLATAIRQNIDWDALPMVSSSALFNSIKRFLLKEKQQGRVLSTVDDLFRGFQQTRPGNVDHDEIRASFETCIGRVESRDLIRRLHFGGLVLLQPELLDAYASAIVQAAKEEPDGLGFIREEDALAGRFRLSAEERIRDQDQERLLLIATVEELLRHEIALKETTDQGMDLVFPSQFTRERPDAPDIPGKHITFVFEGPLHSIYASLAVRLAHSSLFQRQTMWQNAAAYTATVGGSCGIHLRELEEGRGELTLFYDEHAEAAVRSQFEIYVAEHLKLRALPETVVRRTIRSCPLCGYVLPEDLVQGKLGLGMTATRCPMCEKITLSLRDEEPSAQTEAAVSAMNRSADESRNRSVAATRLKGKEETRDYDVFLCYNNMDKAHVTAIGEQLKERGILPWLDYWEIRPGMRWQTELRRTIKSIKSAAIFIGPRGAGPWQELEVEAILQDFIRRKRPIIPIILKGRPGKPRLPAFLSSWQMVDMRKPDPDPFEQLVWGITGEKSAKL
jgi:WD40 repeat protein